MVRFRVSRHRHTVARGFLPRLQLFWNLESKHPDLDSELAINTVATFLVQYVSAEYFGEITIGLDIVQVEMGATPRSANKTRCESVGSALQCGSTGTNGPAPTMWVVCLGIGLVLGLSALS